MKIGISYNLFDGEELLESSIKSIRDNVEYISVVYQTTSNFGNQCGKELVPLLTTLKEKGLIDELYFYKPILRGGGHFNEITKRNIGLSLSERNGCTHHMAMDSDEFYTSIQFFNMKNILKEGNYDSSACQMVTYYKEPIYRLEPKEEYYVSLLFKINPGRAYKINCPFPVLVDPTRRMEGGTCKIFKREEIEMHHMSYVRKNIKTKLTNSSASPNFRDIDRIVNYYNSWKYPKQGLMGGSPDKFYDIVKEEKLFDSWE